MTVQRATYVSGPTASSAQATKKPAAMLTVGRIVVDVEPDLLD